MTNDTIKARIDAALDSLAKKYSYIVEADFPDARGIKTLNVPPEAGYQGVQFAAAMAYAQGARAVRATITFPDPSPVKAELEALAREVSGGDDVKKGEPENAKPGSPELPANVTPITQAKRRLH